MAREHTRTGRSKAKGRAGDVGKLRDRPKSELLLTALRSREFGWAVVIVLLLTAVCAPLAVWTRERPIEAPGRVMTFTREVRVPVQIHDESATQAAQADARQRTPRVYIEEAGVLDEIRSSLLNLPRTLENAETIEDVEAGIVERFALTQERMDAVRVAADEGRERDAWRRGVDQLVELLREAPILDEETWQRESQVGLRGEKFIELRGRVNRPVSDESAINLADRRQLEREASRLAWAAGFRDGQAEVVAARLQIDPKPTYRFDETATIEAQQRAAEAVPAQRREVPRGTIIFRRGDVLSASQFELHQIEMARFREQRPAWTLAIKRFSIGLGVGLLLIAGAVYCAMFCPLLRLSPRRMGWMAGLLGLATLFSCLGTVVFPQLSVVTLTAPVIFAAVIIVIAYDQRTALAVGGLLALLVCLSTGAPLSTLALMGAGIGVAVWHLPDIRSRNTLIRMGIALAVTLGLGSALADLLEGPVTPALLGQAGRDAFLAGVTGVFVAALTMFILPTIERVFDITTGMSLVELRDPKQPLLRELQMRAPGTYNHSLNVASIAEAAADSIKADSLLTYVGGLYHDIGKMSKPEYFVENQAGGPNKHDKLSPAMSLLVIVGHVKDGVEMAREYGLPKPVVHFIEAHHGTTLVEYFYRRAQEQAQEQAAQRKAEKAQKEAAEEGKVVATAQAPPSLEGPEEFEYRYPGPRPRTKEVAILMLADAIESATRTLAEPTPSRIETLVRTIADRRLLDGQFDECNLTLAELRTITESISKTVASIYHGRISYQSDKGESRRESRASRLA